MSQKHTIFEARKKAMKLFEGKSYNLGGVSILEMNEERTMPVCFTPEQLKKVEEYGKRKGMLSASQVIEALTR